MAVRTPQFGIAREHRRVECFGERDVRTVVGCQGFAQCPDARQQLSMRVPLNDEPRKVIERLLSADYRDGLELHQAAQRLRDFYVDQMGSLKSFAGGQCSRGDAFRPIGSQKELEERGGVNDDQRLSRSARTMSVGDSLPR